MTTIMLFLGSHAMKAEGPPRERVITPADPQKLLVDPGSDATSVIKIINWRLQATYPITFSSDIVAVYGRDLI